MDFCYRPTDVIALQVVVAVIINLGFFFLTALKQLGGFRGGSDSGESACNAGDPGLIPGLGRSPGGGGPGSPLQDACLENPEDRRAREHMDFCYDPQLETTSCLTGKLVNFSEPWLPHL